jgi:hypothetical protein
LGVWEGYIGQYIMDNMYGQGGDASKNKKKSTVSSCSCSVYTVYIMWIKNKKKTGQFAIQSQI